MSNRNRKRWLALLLFGGVVAFVWQRWGKLKHAIDNFRRYSMVSAPLYDAWAAPVLGAFYDKVAREVTKNAPLERVLEIGSGPGRLAVRLAQLAPDVHVTGVDITPEMVDLANSLAAKNGLSDRVIFQVGDVAAIPFPDASFDLAISTLSMHHWENPAKGLAEIHRVLRPNGIAVIYDMADWIRRIETSGAGISALVADGPFQGHGAYERRTAVRFGPVPIIFRAELRKRVGR